MNDNGTVSHTFIPFSKPSNFKAVMFSAVNLSSHKTKTALKDSETLEKLLRIPVRYCGRATSALKQDNVRI
jgi:hypothetical protein